MFKGLVVVVVVVVVVVAEVVVGGVGGCVKGKVCRELFSGDFVKLSKSVSSKSYGSYEIYILHNRGDFVRLTVFEEVYEVRHELYVCKFRSHTALT
jgi:hypothetical protein